MATLLDAGLRAWRDDPVAQGVARGQGRDVDRGRAHEWPPLRRLAGRRFGAATAQRLSSLLRGLKAADELAAVGDRTLDCESGADLLARIRAR